MLRSETGYDRAELWLVDQADFSSVKSFADKFEEQGGRLDYLILNAGVAMPDYSATKDGWELRYYYFISLCLLHRSALTFHSLQVNCLSTSLIALLLLPHMTETARKHSVTPRLVVVSSGTLYRATFDQQIRDSHEPLKIFGSKEYCTSEYVVCCNHLYCFLILDRVMKHRYPDTKRKRHHLISMLLDN